MSIFGSINGFNGEYEFLSNFWPAKVTLDGVEYPSTENAYQAAKTVDVQERLHFRNCTPGKAKRLGKSVTKREDWDEVKIPIMLNLNMQKFKNHPELQLKLLMTDEMLIEETNHWGDVFWGVCDGKGRNELGKVLMIVRQVIRKEIEENLS